MSTTQTNTQGDSQAEPYGSTLDDVLAEAPDSVKVKVANAEQEMLLQHLLGLDFRTVHQGNPNARALATDVVQALAGRIDTTRQQIAGTALQDLLERNIDVALRGVETRATGVKSVTDPVALQRVRAVAEAIYSSIPKDILDSLLRYSMPAAIQVGTNLNKHKLYLDIKADKYGSLVNGPRANPDEGDYVVIDTRAKFWVENGPFETPEQLATVLEGKQFTYCGIELSKTNAFPSATIDQRLAIAIAHKNLNVIKLSNKYQTRLEKAQIGGAMGAELNFSLDINNLVSTEYTPQIPGSPRYLGEATFDQLRFYFGVEANRNRFVKGLEDCSNFARIYKPEITGAGTMPLVEFLTQLAFNRIGSPTTGPLATEDISVFEIQKELREQHQYHTRLRQGSDNHAGAALAASILMRYKDVGDVMDLPDKTKTETELANDRSSLNLQNMLDKLEALSGFNPTYNLQELHDARTDIATRLSRGVTPGASFTISMPGGPMPYQMPPISSPAENARNIQIAYQWLAEREKEIKDQMKIYEQLQQLVRPIYQELQRIGTPAALGATLAGFYAVVGGRLTANLAAYTTDLDFKQLAENVRQQLGLKSKEDLEKSVEGNKKMLEDIEAGKMNGKFGSSAQFEVIKRYFEQYHGCTADEAKAAANYLLGRSKLDTELTQLADTVSGDLYGDGARADTNTFEHFASNLSLSPEAHSAEVIRHLADSIGIPVRPWGSYMDDDVFYDGDRNPVENPNQHFDDFHSFHKPHWAKASYRKLITAYYAMKKLSNGGGPKEVQMQRSRYLQFQMKEITRILMKEHSARILREFGPSHNITGEDAEEMMKDPSKAMLARTLEEMLAGEPVAGYNAAIAHAIAHAEHRTAWGRKKLKNATLKTIGIGKAAAVGGFNAVVWGSKKALNATDEYVVKPTKSALSKIWQYKAPIALSIIGGPILGVASWYTYKHFAGEPIGDGSAPAAH